MIDEQRLVSSFLALARIDSLSSQEQEVGEWVAAALRDLGAEVERDEVGNLLGRLSGRGEPLLLNAHLDTVGPVGGIEPVLADGVIRSDGRTILGADDKAGVAIILEVVRAATEHGVPLPPLDLLFTVQEEIGLRGARAFDMSRLRAREGIGLDSGGVPGTVAVSAPTHDNLTAIVHGAAAHAGAEPEKGISAIVVAAEAITRMPLGRIDEETTANIGLISGGRALNIVPDLVEVKGEARSRDPARLEAQVRSMVSAFEEAAARHGATVDVEVTRVYVGYRLGPDEPIIRLLAAGAAEAGLELNCIATGGGSDANIFNAAGIRIVNISCGMDQVHTTHEQIAVGEMVRCAEWLLACLRLRTASAA
ncbi:MAG: M20/M25/M40 family metallo-hydrolase [Anaerolineae bacterium]|nr:M20/M25/M40 family metallo-hydrolase [Anaerolineae bacterium]